MCALLTDSVRECVLKDLGYDVDMIEFIDFEHSPKNIMIRAKFTGRTHTKGRETVKALQEKYGFKTTAIVTMKEVVEHLYNREYKGKVIIDDTLKAAIDAYYKQYGAK